ncbi:MAG: hypothetical protein Q4F66_13425, partial [Clostridium sp.]|nr:hypothetical protein [Clostridium sp.]
AASIGVVGIPLALLTGLAGTYGGKSITKLAFRKSSALKKIEEIKASYRQSTTETIRQFRNSKELEVWMSKQTDAAFDGLRDKVNEETEAFLHNTEATLGDVRADLVKNRKEKEDILKECDRLEQEVKDAFERINPIAKKLKEQAIDYK